MFQCKHYGEAFFHRKQSQHLMKAELFSSVSYSAIFPFKQYVLQHQPTENLVNGQE